MRFGLRGARFSVFVSYSAPFAGFTHECGLSRRSVAIAGAAHCMFALMVGQPRW